MNTLVRYPVVVVSLSLMVASSSTQGLEPLRVVAISEDIGLEAPLIDAAGRTLFLTSRPPRGRSVADDSLTAAALTLDATTRGLYAETHLGMPELVAGYGEQPPGTQVGTSLFRFENLRLNASGDIAFTGILSGAEFGNAHFGRQAGESLRMIVRGGQTISLPDMTEDQVYLKYSTIFPIALDDDGLLTSPAYIQSLFAFTDWLEFGQDVLRESTDGSVQLAENKVTVSTTTKNRIPGPGGDRGTVEFVPSMLDVTAVPNSPITVNTKGDIAYWATLVPPANHGTEFRQTEAIVNLSASGANQVLVQQWDTVLDEQTSLYRFDYPTQTAMNSWGDLAFTATLTGGAFGRAILRSTGDELNLVANEIAPAPGTEEGTTILNFRPTIWHNDRQETLFQTSLAGPSITGLNDRGIYIDRPGQELSLVAREGGPAPGAEEGVTFNDLYDSNATLNNAGQVAFSTYLRNTDSTSDFGIWAQNRQGELQLIAREGDELDVSDPGEPADLRTIQSLYFLETEGNGPAYGTAFNDRGQLAFAARFTDGSYGVFVSNAVAVPEPMSIAMLGGGLMMATVYRVTRHRHG